ncbi:helix-turn-helix domain-containing protein [uncultured Tateyamaria sp.]|nr:helix-turn-helix domain-containing protein [uncultured Tateyamaria sp.]
MATAGKPDWNGCPTRYAAGIVGDKWCFLLLRDALLHGKRTYREFLASPEGISTNILANRLSKLEALGMFTREPDPRKASSVCYFPTQKAKDFLPALVSMMVWATQYDEVTEAPASFAVSYVDDPKGTIAWYEAEMDRVDQALRTG